MSDATATLDKEIGGVKVKWLLVIGLVAFVGGILWRRYRGTPTPTADTLPETGTPPVSSPDTYTEDTGYSTAGGTNLGGGFAYSGNGAGTSTYSTTATNQAWAIAAANGLTGQGQWAPLDIQNALSNYINGKPLTAQQQAIVNAAVAAYGSPPENVLPSSAAPTGPVGPRVWYKSKSSGTIYVVWPQAAVFAGVTPDQWVAAGKPSLTPASSATISANRTRIAYTG